MKKSTIFIVIVFLLVSLKVYSQSNSEKPITYPFSVLFKKAYQSYPDVPTGLLEAVAFTMTHIHHIDSTTSGSCMGIPRVYGVMGLTLDGKGYFRNNLLLVSQISGFKVNDIIDNPEINIRAYASAYSALKKQLGINSINIEQQISIIKALSEIPDNLRNEFALNSYIYAVITFLNNTENQSAYTFPNYQIDMTHIFGVDKYKILSSPQVTIRRNTQQTGTSEGHDTISAFEIQSTDYPPAIWNPAASCNYAVGRTAAISAVAIHDTEGSYSGTISWFQSCPCPTGCTTASACSGYRPCNTGASSAHYVIRSSDGQVTQMVSEADKAYHIGSENGYTIGIEHEGYCSQTGWYSNAMYSSSANLVKDICNSGYGISPTSTYSGSACSCSQSSSACLQSSAIKIKGHQMFPNQTHFDPGINWDWAKYYNRVFMN